APRGPTASPCVAAVLSPHNPTHPPPSPKASPNGRHRRSVGAERQPHPFRKHRRKAQFPAVRYLGKNPPLAGACARDFARELSAHARLPAASASARVQGCEVGSSERGGEAA